MKKENNLINDTTISDNKTIEGSTIITKSFIQNPDNDNKDNKNITNLYREAFLLTRRAENKLNLGCCLDTICTSKSKRYTEACKLYNKAGDKYKICNQWRKAADCYDNCSQIKLSLKENPLKFYQESFLCYSKINNYNNTRRLVEKMNKFLEKEGDYYQAGKNNENLGIINENNEKYSDAINYYSQALNYYEIDGKHESLKINMKIKIAELMMLCNHPEAPLKVPDLMENIGNTYLKNPVIKNSAKEFFGKAILSKIYYSDNRSEWKIYINKLKNLDKIFEESNEYKLCYDIINSLNNNDNYSFQNSINNYKEICKVDQFTINIFDKLEEKFKKYNNKEKSNENEFF